MKLINKTIGECLKERVRLSGERTAIETGGFRCTFEQLDRFSDFLAVQMGKDRIEKGTHVGIWSTNSPEWVSVFLALTKIGAVPVLVNTCLRDAEVTRILSYADVEVLYYGAGGKTTICDDLIETIRSKSPNIRRFISIHENIAGTWESGLSKAACSPQGLEELAQKKNQVKPADPACMIFTSGTTSFSKGVILSHYSMVNNSLAMVKAMQWNENDKMCLTVPLFHCFGVTAGILACLISGAEMDLLPCFRTSDVWDGLEQKHDTILNGVPSMFLALIRKPEHRGRCADSLKSGIIAGSPVTPEEYAEICERFPQMHLQPSYGQTETSPCVTIAGWDDPIEQKGRSAGRPIDHVSTRIADCNTGNVLAQGHDGEIQVKGYNVMIGYYNLPDVTAGTFTSDGWLKTGDIGHFDQLGELHVTGRLKEMIIRGGENISPQEIERAIKKLTWVEQVKVVGVPAAVLQEEIAACIVPKRGCEINAGELHDFLKPRLAHYKLPTYVLRFDAFPMNASGKIKLKDLKSKAAAMVKNNQCA
ncbi:MAG: AMP-binding protein [Oscillospiraceae bacterium]|jgi:fatty-acyl-CoA synthase|nr:AMP-binding protein [Oscillospiraceae bacterium]